MATPSRRWVSTPSTPRSKTAIPDDKWKKGLQMLFEFYSCNGRGIVHGGKDLDQHQWLKMCEDMQITNLISRQDLRKIFKTTVTGTPALLFLPEFRQCLKMCAKAAFGKSGESLKEMESEQEEAFFGSLLLDDVAGLKEMLGRFRMSKDYSVQSQHRPAVSPHERPPSVRRKVQSNNVQESQTWSAEGEEGITPNTQEDSLYSEAVDLNESWEFHGDEEQLHHDKNEELQQLHQRNLMDLELVRRSVREWTWKEVVTLDKKVVRNKEPIIQPTRPFSQSQTSDKQSFDPVLQSYDGVLHFLQQKAAALEKAKEEPILRMKPLWFELSTPEFTEQLQIWRQHLTRENRIRARFSKSLEDNSSKKASTPPLLGMWIQGEGVSNNPNNSNNNEQKQTIAMSASNKLNRIRYNGSPMLARKMDITK